MSAKSVDDFGGDHAGADDCEGLVCKDLVFSHVCNIAVHKSLIQAKLI